MAHPGVGIVYEYVPPILLCDTAVSVTIVFEMHTETCNHAHREKPQNTDCSALD